MKNEEIRQLYLDGLSYKAIGQKYQIDERTAKRYVELNLPLSDLEHRPFRSVLDPYKEYIDSWLRNKQKNASVIHRWLLENGCECSYSLVNRYVRKKIQEYEKAGFYQNDVTYKRTNTTNGEIILSIQDKINREIQHVYDRKKK